MQTFVELAEAKIKTWTEGVTELRTKHQQLSQELARIEAMIQTNIGAITGAKELLSGLAPEATGDLALPLDTELPLNTEIPVG